MTSPGEPPIPQLSSDELVARLDQHELRSPMLAFDADGTLWSGDIGVDVFGALLEARGVRPVAGTALSDEARSYGLPVDEDANEQARLLYEGFGRGAYPEARLFAMMAWAFAGYSLGEARAFAATVIHDVGLTGRIHPEVVPIWRWAETRGVPLYVVSASPAHVVRTAVALLDLPVADVFAMSPVVVDGVLTARMVEPLTYGAGKLEALRAAVPAQSLLGAFGDSVFDLAMLSAAQIPVLVRPKPELVAHASSCPGILRLTPSSS